MIAPIIIGYLFTALYQPQHGLLNQALGGLWEPLVQGVGRLLHIGGMAAYAYRLTADRWYGEQARLCYDRVAESGGTSLDMAPLLGEMLAGLRLFDGDAR